jgi:hypothetical protein
MQDRCFDRIQRHHRTTPPPAFVQCALRRHAADARTPPSVLRGPRASNKRVGSTSSRSRSLASPRVGRYHRHVLKKKPCTRGAGHAPRGVLGMHHQRARARSLAPSQHHHVKVCRYMRACTHVWRPHLLQRHNAAWSI